MEDGKVGRRGGRGRERERTGEKERRIGKGRERRQRIGCAEGGGRGGGGELRLGREEERKFGVGAVDRHQLSVWISNRASNGRGGSHRRS